MARPKIKIDWEQVDRMCAIHCTGEEQASLLEVDYDTLNRACKRDKGLSFADYFKQKSAGGKMSLRRRQYTSAMEGNTTMLVWLGKNWLGQTDKEEKHDNEKDAQPMTFTFNVNEAKSEVQVTKGKK